jgi:gas vesicle protein
MAQEKNEIGGLLAGLAIGTLIGTIVGLLIAPEPGEVTRRKLKYAMEELPEKAKKASKKVRDLLQKKECEGDTDQNLYASEGFEE